MKASVFTAPGTIQYMDYPEPEVGDGILLEIKACGVCGTDVKALKGNRPGFKPPMILGHEFSGQIIESHVPGYKEGDSIGVAPYAGCGECAFCQSGYEELCQQKLYVSGGAFAERLAVPATLVRKTAWKIPAEIGWEVAALAEPLACCIRSLLASRWQPGWSILVVGAGSMGLIHVQLAKAWGARTILVSEPDESRRMIAADLGAKVFDPGTGDDLSKWAAQKTGGFGPNLVIVAVGDVKVVESVIDCAAPGGTVHVFGGLPKDIHLSVSAYTIHYREVALIGTSGFRTSDYKLAADLIANCVIDLQPLISARLNLRETENAIKLAGERSALKVMLLP